MEIENPWHEKTQEEIAELGSQDKDVARLRRDFLSMDKNKREAVMYKLYLEVKDLDPVQHEVDIINTAALLILVDKSAKDGNKHNLPAGNLLSKIRDRK